MPRTAIVLCLCLMAALATGCAFVSKEVKLKKVPSAQPESDKLQGIPFKVVVKDEREGDHKSVGATGWSFRSLITTDDVSKWVSRHLAKELENAGGEESEDAVNQIVCLVKACDASWGFWSNIKTNLAIDVAVEHNGEKVPLGELQAEQSTFSFIDSSSRFENALAEILGKWLKSHSPAIIGALAKLSKEPGVEPEEPAKPTRPTTKPEERTIPKPAKPPMLLNTGPPNHQQFRNPNIEIFGEAMYAIGGLVRITLNNKEVASTKIKIAQKRFSIPAKLRLGKNDIKIILTPKSGKPITKDLSVSFLPPPLRDRRALILGVEKFTHLTASTGAAKAAADVHEILGAGTEPKDKSKIILLESKVSLSQFLAKLREVFTAAEKSETVIIFYSGAVLPTLGDMALAVRETDSGKLRTAVLLSDIAMNADRYFSGKTVLLIVQGEAGKALPKLPDLAGLGSAMSILTFAPSKGNSSAVPAALAGKADAGADGYVTLSELRKYLDGKGTAAFSGKLEAGFCIARLYLKK
ncbi:MAG: hypothetical protein E3J72_00820 [Planctomycetota bacterium]|nr:MAG: hypothetical protein E3J72_00820 [Planctomycetota bacterium]